MYRMRGYFKEYYRIFLMYFFGEFLQDKYVSICY
jgi:hypothetical protein